MRSDEVDAPATEDDPRRLRVFLASYAHVKDGQFTKLGGPALALANHLRPRIKRLTCVWQPVLISETAAALLHESHAGRDRRIGEFRLLPDSVAGTRDFTWPYYVQKVRDVLSVIFAVVRLHQRYDLYVGVESHNALIGVLLRRLGITRRVVYYVMDYGETRFKLAWLNRVFHGLDRLAARHADATWNLSEWMIRTRASLGLDPMTAGRQLVVPIGTEYDEIERPPFEATSAHAIGYIGLLSEHTGVRLLADAIPDILQAVPAATFLIVGTGPLASEMEARARIDGYADRVTFAGVLSDDEAARALAACAVGIAPYDADPDSIKRFTDVTKPKLYLSCGLPVVITRVPPIAREIEARGAGVACAADPQALAAATIGVISDPRHRRALRDAAMAMAASYAWDAVFDRALRETLAADAASAGGGEADAAAFDPPG